MENEIRFDDVAQNTNEPQIDYSQDISKQLADAVAAEQSQGTDTPVEGTEAKPAETQAATAPQTPTEAEVLKKQVADKEAFIQRQAAEIGELRKIAVANPPQTAQPQQPQVKIYTEDEINSTWYENPAKAFQMAEHNKQVQAYTQQAHISAVAKQTESTLRQLVPDIDDLKDSMAELALQDGYNPQQVAWFKQNPFVNSDPVILYQYAQRAKAIKEINTLKSQTMQNVAAKVEQAAQGQGLTSKVAASSTRKPVMDVDISRMSPLQIKAALEENLKSEWG